MEPIILAWKGGDATRIQPGPQNRLRPPARTRRSFSRLASCKISTAPPAFCKRCAKKNAISRIGDRVTPTSTALWPSNRGCNKTARIARPAPKAARPAFTREGQHAAKRSVKSHTAGLPACPSSDKPFSICSSRKSLKYSKHRLRFKAASSGNLQLPKSLGQNTGSIIVEGQACTCTW